MYHFQEYIEDGQVDFNYVLYPGPVTTRNAIRLLEMKGYDDSIINNAIDLIDYFEKHGEWTCCNED
jgi:DNA mismatch repair ATPase MutS